jgi:Amt family ammonium transporter
VDSSHVARTRARMLLSAGVLSLRASTAAHAQEAAGTLNAGDTAWILVSTALVLFMTLPGLALFYGGLVRTRNVLSLLMQCLILTALMSVVWLVAGYSLSFDEGNRFIGSLTGKAFLAGIDPSFVPEGSTIPEVLFFAFQMTFAVITPGLIIGAFAERVRFSAVLLFSTLWMLLVYAPICHMTWGGGLFSEWGVLDFAGGIVVHITAGSAALLACIMVGKRDGYPKQMMPPHNLTMTFTGTAMLWVGWFGFNAGSQLAADGGAAMALVVTHLSASVATLTWMGIEWLKFGRPSVLGAATGSIAGLAAVTPASGFIGPVGGMAIGLVAGSVCWYFATAVKNRFGYDDSLDVFGVHGIGGLIGTILAGVFAAGMFGGNQGGAETYSIASQVLVQSQAALITVVYTLIVSGALLWFCDKTVGLRVDSDSEREGLDISSHNESGYNM